VLPSRPRSPADRGDGARDRGGTENVVRAGRLFDPPWIETRETLHLPDGFAHVPTLIRVHHETPLAADLLAHQRCAAHVVLEIGTDLHLERGPAFRDRL